MKFIVVFVTVRFWIEFEHFLRKSGVKLRFFGESAKIKLIVVGEKAELNCVLHIQRRSRLRVFGEYME